MSAALSYHLPQGLLSHLDLPPGAFPKDLQGFSSTTSLQLCLGDSWASQHMTSAALLSQWKSILTPSLCPTFSKSWELQHRSNACPGTAPLLSNIG